MVAISLVLLAPLGAQMAPGPAVRDHRPAPPGPLAGEFVFRTKLKGAYLSAQTGELSAASTVGPNEKFRITVVSPQYRMIQTARGAYLALTGSQYPGDGRPLRMIVAPGGPPTAPAIGYNAEFELIPWTWGH